MANYCRTVLSSLWSNKSFRKLNHKEKVFYFLLHTGEISSDTSAFPCMISDCALYCGISVKEIEKMLQHFEELGYIFYDYDTEEICVLDYFVMHSPAGGITYEMYRKDLAKITSDEVLDAVVENSKKYDISLPFFAALQDFRPTIKEEDFSIKNCNKSIDEIRTAAKRGRIKAKGGIKIETEALEQDDICEEELPF